MPMEILLLVLLGGMLVFMFVSSRRRATKMKEQEALRQTRMVPGAKVMSRAGLYGTLVAFDASDLTTPALVEIAPGTIVELHPQSIDLAPETELDAAADDVDTETDDVIEEPNLRDEASTVDAADVNVDPTVVEDATAARADDAADGVRADQPDDKPQS